MEIDTAATEAALRELVAIRSVKGGGGEAAAAGWVQDYLAKRGIASEILCKDPARPNVLARLGPAGGADPLVLISHIDVVDADEARWSHPPFSADVADGRIWGRGTLDTKHLTVMELAAFAALKAREGELRRPVWLLATVDEECGSEYGMAEVRRRRPEVFKNAVVINEGGGFPLRIHGRDYMTVTVGEKGVCKVRLTAEGRGGHASSPGPCEEQAVQKLAAAVHRMFAGTEALTAGACLRPLIEQAIGTDAPDSPVARAIWTYAGENRVTMRDYQIGERSNVLPARAGTTVEFRVLPGVKAADVERYAAACCEGLGVAVQVESFEPGFLADVDSPEFARFTGALRKACAARGMPCGVMPMLAFGRTDGRFFGAGAKAVYGCSPLLMGDSFDEILPKVHGDDESILQQSFAFGCRVLADVVDAELAG